MANLGSLDVPVTGINGNEDSTVGDLVAAPGDLADEITERMDAEALGCVLWGCVDELPDDQRDVIRKRYQDGETFPAIGSQLGSDPHVAQRIHNKAIRTLRGTRYTKRLRPFLPEADRIYSCALWGNGVGRFNRTWTSSTERVALDL